MTDRVKYLHDWYQRNKAQIKDRKRKAQALWLKRHPGMAYKVTKKYRKLHPEKFELQRRSTVVKKYGLSNEDFDRMMTAQNGVCAICGKPSITISLHIDHTHVRGFTKMLPVEKRKYVRGLVCYRCNRFLIGRWKREDAPLFDKAAAYLRRDKALGL